MFALRRLAFALALAGAPLPALAALTPSPTSLTFPDTGTGSISAEQAVTYTNTGMAQVSISSIAMTGTDPGDYVLSNVPGLPIALGPGVQISINVQFQPAAVGQRPATLRAILANGGGNVDVPVTGKGIGPKAVVAPAPIVVGGKPFGQAQPPTMVTVTNGGGSILHVSGVSITGVDAARFSLTGLPGFPQALTANQSFSFTVNFTPLAAGQANANLIVASDDPMNPMLSTAIIGRAGSPQVSLDIGTIVFGNQRVGISSAGQDVNITNTGLSDLHVTGIVLGGTNPGDFVLTAKPALPLTLMVGQSAKFTVAFSPTAAGARSANVMVVSDDPASPKLLPVSGMGTTPMVSIAPAMLDFGTVTVGMMGSRNFTAMNAGTGVVQVTQMAITGADAAAFKTNIAAPFNVPAMGQTVVQVTYKPTKIGAAAATITMMTDDPNLPQFQIALTGMGTSPMFSVMPTLLDFGAVGVGTTTAAKTVTIANNGNQPLTIESFTLIGSDQSDFNVMNPPMAGDTVAVGANVTFAVTFTPSANATENAEIDITSDDPNMPSAAVKLTGLGAQPGLDVTPSPTLDFMMVQIGSQGKSSVKLTNSGRADLHIGSVKLSGAMASQFGDDAQAPLVLTANMSASFNVTYTPTMAGAGMATLEVDPTDTGLVPVMITLKGIGVSPQVSATPLMIDFGPIPLGQSAVAQVVTVRNGGVNPVVIDKLACANAAFGPPASNLGMMIPPKMSIDFMVTFSPTMDGLQNASLQFFLKDAVSPAAQVMVSGTGVAGVNKGGCAVGRGRARAMAPLALIGLFGLWLSRRRRRAG